MRRGFVVGGGICLVLLVWACDSAGRSVAETRDETALYRSARPSPVREAPAYSVGLAKTDGSEEQRDALAMPGARDVLPNLIIRNGTALRMYEVPVLNRSMFIVFVDLLIVAIAAFGAVMLKTDTWSPAAVRETAVGMMASLAPVSVVVFWRMKRPIPLNI